MVEAFLQVFFTQALLSYYEAPMPSILEFFKVKSTCLSLFTAGATGDSITISGSSFSTNTAEVSVTIDNVACTITSAAVDSIECDVGAHSAGTYPVVVYIEDKGLSADDAEFEYELRVDSVSPIEGELVVFFV